MGVIDVDPRFPRYGRLVGQVDFPHGDNELHHFGWNACSACLCPQAPHPHMERRYLIVPGIGSSRIHILDTKPDPRQPKIVKVIEPEEFIQQDRLHLAAHDSLRPRRHLWERARFGQRRRPRRHFPDGSRDVRAERASGKRTAARSIWPTTSGGTWATTPWSPPSGARPTW